MNDQHATEFKPIRLGAVAASQSPEDDAIRRAVETATSSLAKAVAAKADEIYAQAIEAGCGVLIIEEPIRTEGPVGEHTDWRFRISQRMGPHPLVPAGETLRFPDQDAFHAWTEEQARKNRNT